MAITKEKKAEILTKLKDALKEAKSLVFVNFHGLSVGVVNDMRRALKGDNVKYFVAKNNLIRKALDEQKFDGETPALTGELALAWGEDLIAPARGVYDFQKKNPDSLKIIGGIFEGKFMNQTEMMEIATIPSVPVLQGKFVNIINSPIQRLVIALAKIGEGKN